MNYETELFITFFLMNADSVPREDHAYSFSLIISPQSAEPKVSYTLL
jgi:hypothetical protein